MFFCSCQEPVVWKPSDALIDQDSAVVVVVVVVDPHPKNGCISIKKKTSHLGTLWTMVQSRTLFPDICSSFWLVSLIVSIPSDRQNPVQAYLGSCVSMEKSGPCGSAVYGVYCSSWCSLQGV